jgi:hypothetical protein
MQQQQQQQQTHTHLAADLLQHNQQFSQAHQQDCRIQHILEGESGSSSKGSLLPSLPLRTAAFIPPQTVAGFIVRI